MPGRRIATVLMLDVVGSTHVAAELGDARYRELSSRFNRSVRASLKRFGGKEEDHAGDGFFATFPQPDQAIRCAAALAEEVRSLGIEIRSGIHTGQTEDQAGKTHGIAVVIGARVMSLADAGEILVTSTTKELTTGSGFGFEDFSAHELKGVPGTWQVFGVTAVDGAERGLPLPAAEAAEPARDDRAGRRPGAAVPEGSVRCGTRPAGGGRRRVRGHPWTPRIATPHPVDRCAFGGRGAGRSRAGATHPEVDPRPRPDGTRARSHAPDVGALDGGGPRGRLDRPVRIPLPRRPLTLGGASPPPARIRVSRSRSTSRKARTRSGSRTTGVSTR